MIAFYILFRLDMSDWMDTVQKCDYSLQMQSKNTDNLYIVYRFI